MATARIIAYPMHEEEHAAAAAAMRVEEATDAYVIGTIDEADLDDFASKVVVQRLLQPQVRLEQAQARTNSFGDTSDVAPDLSAAPPPLRRDEVGEFVIGLVGPLLPDWHTQLDNAGVTISEYVPDNSYLVTGTAASANQAGSLPFVRDVSRADAHLTGPMLISAPDTVPGISPIVPTGRPWPASPRPGVGPGGGAGAPEAGPAGSAQVGESFDIEYVERAYAEGGAAEAAEPDDEEEALLAWNVWLRSDEGRGQVISDLEALPGVRVLGNGPRKVRVEFADPHQSTEVQAWASVARVMQYVPPVLHNDLSRPVVGIEGANGTTIGLTGAGQIVGVADTGLDSTHPDFAGRTKIIPHTGNAISDPRAHGTHVAGSAVGDGTASNGKFAGVAPKATLVFQAIADGAGQLQLPVALAELFQEAYDEGVRVHNNSWGTTTSQSPYTIESTEVDEFVATHRDFLVVLSAGNDGSAFQPTNSPIGFVDLFSVGSPATAKNALTVGAFRSGRTDGGYAAKTWHDLWPKKYPDPTLSEETVSGDPQKLAAFSSRGPCDDMRIKPDLVAPGTDIISARAANADPAHFWGLFDQHYAYMGGTSMAAPLVTGCAALVREYYTTNGHAAPSAALLKATLLNGTTWLNGPDAMMNNAVAPNYHQGFGAINVAQSVPNPLAPELKLGFVDNWQQPGNQLGITGARHQFTTTVADGLPFRVCLAYTDPPARAVQNDLMLIVEHAPSRQKWVGNHTLPGGLVVADAVNNVEIVRIDDPPAGDYVVTVIARNLLLGPGEKQDYALVATGVLDGLAPA